MKFETPIMHIAIFEVENIVTASNPTTEAKLSLVNTSLKSVEKGLKDIEDAKILTFTY